MLSATTTFLLLETNKAKQIKASSQQLLLLHDPDECGTSTFCSKLEEEEEEEEATVYNLFVGCACMLFHPISTIADIKLSRWTDRGVVDY